MARLTSFGNQIYSKPKKHTFIDGLLENKGRITLDITSTNHDFMRVINNYTTTENIELEKLGEEKYKVSFDIKSGIAREIKRLAFNGIIGNSIGYLRLYEKKIGRILE